MIVIKQINFIFKLNETFINKREMNELEIISRQLNFSER